jgi:BMFP domain-containing protein YqiC
MLWAFIREERAEIAVIKARLAALEARLTAAPSATEGRALTPKV